MLRAWLARLVLCCLPLLAWVPAWAEPRIVTLAIDEAYPPYSYSDGGPPAGLYVQLLQRAMQGLDGWELHLQPRPWVRALQEAEQGRVDGVLPPYRGLGRDWIGLYAGPLHREEVVLSCRPATRLGPASQWPDDFAGRRIGVMRGYLLSAVLTHAFQQGQVLKREFRNARDALSALASDDIDCYANDRLSIELAHGKALADSVWATRVPARLEPAYVLSGQQAFIGFSQQSLAKRPELAEFAHLLEAELALLRTRGEMQRLVEQARATPPQP